MTMTSNELIHRYLLGIASDDDVKELESRLQGDEALQDELLLQQNSTPTCDRKHSQDRANTKNRKRTPSGNRRMFGNGSPACRRWPRRCCCR